MARSEPAHFEVPGVALERITCPVLANFGDMDRLVPVEASIRVFKAAFAEAGSTDATIRVDQGADHRIRIGEPFQFAAGYLGEMSAWVAARAGVAVERPRRLSVGHLRHTV